MQFSNPTYSFGTLSDSFGKAGYLSVHLSGCLYNQVKTL